MAGSCTERLWWMEDGVQFQPVKNMHSVLIGRHVLFHGKPVLPLKRVMWILPVLG